MAAVSGKNKTVSLVRVTYVSSPPQDFERFATLPTPAFLWMQSGGSGKPLTDVKVVYDNAEVGEGYEKIPEDLNNNQSEHRVFLAVSSTKGVGPIVGLKVVTEGEQIGVDWTKVDNDLLKTASGRKFLCIKYKDGTARAIKDYQVGDNIDCLDTVQKWCTAKIVSLNATNGTALVHYNGWSDKFDEWLNLSEPRIAPFRTHTSSEHATGCKQNQGAFHVTEEYVKVFIGVADQIDKLAKVKSFNEEQIAFLKEKMTPTLCNMLNGIIDDMKVIPRVHQMCLRILDMCLLALGKKEHMSDSLVFALVRIFGGDSTCSRFYTRYGLAKSDAAKPPKFAKQAATSEDLSTYKVDLMEYFGARKGFDTLCERIGNRNQCLSFQHLHYLLLAIHGCKQTLNTKFKHDFFPKLQSAVHVRLDNLQDDEIKNIDRQLIIKVLNSLESLLSKLLKPEEISQCMETLNLSLCLRFIQCPYLDKRVFGISELGEVIEKVDRTARRAQQSGRYYNNYYQNAYEPKAAKYLTPELLIQWMEERNLVSILLGRSSHEEIIKRTPAILKFLSGYKKLRWEHLNMLWAAAEGKHETIVLVVYDAIVELAKNLKSDHIDAFFKKITEIPLDKYNDKTLSFLKKFTANAIPVSTKKDKFYGVPIFWDLVQDGVGISEELAKQAFSDLYELLHTYDCESQRIVYIKACIDNLRKGVSVPQSLRLCRILIATYPPKSHSGFSAINIVEQLEENNHLLMMIIKDCLAYKKKAAANGGKITGSSFSHQEQVSERLEFLQYVLADSKLRVAEDHIHGLWTTLVDNPIEPGDKDLLMKWLSTGCGKSSYDFFSTEVESHVFHKYLCNSAKMDFRKLSLASYACFQTFFESINHSNKVLSKFDFGFMEVLKWELSGLDSLWEIALNADNHEVASASARNLIRCYLGIQSRLNKEEIWRSYIDNCMRTMCESQRTLQSKKDDESEVRMICRALTLLDGFLQKCSKMAEKKPIKMQKPTSQAGMYPYRSHMKFEIAVIGGQHLNLRIGDEHTFGYIRNEVASFLKEKTHQLKIICRGKTLWPDEYDELTPMQTGMYDPRGDNVLELQILPVDHPDAIMQGSPDAYMVRQAQKDYPLKLLSNDEHYFDLLFDLLNIGGDVAQRVWTLLNAIPTNEVLYRNIRSFHQNATNKPNWVSLLNSKSTLKMLYCLEILDSALSSPDQLDVEWSMAFVEKGGLRHILDLFMCMDLGLAFSDLLPKRCLTLLLKLTNHFLLGQLHTTASHATAAVDKSSLVVRLIDVIFADTHSSACIDGDLVHMCFNLLLFYFEETPKFLELFFGFKQLSELLTRGLVYHKVAAFRNKFATGLYQLCAKCDNVGSPNPARAQLLPLLLQFVPLIDTKSPTCKEYFDLIQRLLKEAGQFGAKGYFDPAQLLHELSLKLSKHPIIEVRADTEDAVLRGLLNLITAVISIHPDLRSNPDLVAEIVQKCLFDLPHSTKMDDPPPKCKSMASRIAAFELVNELCKNNETNTKVLLKLLLPNHMQTHSRGMNPNEWEFAPQMQEKSSTGYVGIRNLGCICYMNSLIQQLFMMPGLRSGLLAIEDREPDKTDSFLYQLQYIMGYLQESEKQYVNPAGFCHAFKDWDGNPTDVKVQMDTQEFLNMLFDRIDTKLKGTVDKDLLSNHLGGVFSNELIGKGCPHYSEREEQFYCVGLEVKNKKTLEDSLNLFIQGEMLEGDNAYMCSHCKKKVDTLKRVVLKKLPPTIAFQLKRFEFDFATMDKLKVDDRLEFPMRLNLKPYTKEGVYEKQGQTPPQPTVSKSDQEPDDGDSKQDIDGKDQKHETISHPDHYYEYELSGILIHMGSANGGHYYSYIKERVPMDEIAQGREPLWFEFNDAVVRPFDAADIPNEAFGGVEQRQSAYQSQVRSYSKCANAYLLFYDRVIPNLDVLPNANKPSQLSFQAAAQALRFVHKVKERPTLQRRESEKTRVPLPPKIFNSIWEENYTYWKDKYVFDPSYFGFMFEFLSSIPIEIDDRTSLAEAEGSVSLTALQLSTRFFVETLARSDNKESLGKWVTLLKKMYESSLPGSIWLLMTMSSESGWSHDLLLECKSSLVRRVVSNLIEKAMKRVLPIDVDKPSGSSYLINYADCLVSMLCEAPKHWKHFREFFLVLKNLAALHAKYAYYLIEHWNMIPRTIDFLMGDASTCAKYGDMPLNAKGQRTTMGNIWNQPDFSHLFGMLSILICYTFSDSKPQRIDKVFPSGRQTKDLISLPEDQLKILFNKDFQSYLFASGGTNKLGGIAVSDIARHWCFESKQRTDQIITVIMLGISERNYEEIRPYFRVLSGLLQLQDSLTESRVDMVFSSLLNEMETQQAYWKETNMCIEHLIRFAINSPVVCKWMKRHSKRLAFVARFLRNPRPSPYSHTNIKMQKPPRVDPFAAWRTSSSSSGYGAYGAYGGGMGAYGAYSDSAVYGLSLHNKLQAIEDIAAGKAISYQFEESDDDLAERDFKVGDKIDCLDTMRKWLPSTVIKQTELKIFVHYDDWASKWDEWVDKTSDRVAKAGTHTGKQSTKMRY